MTQEEIRNILALLNRVELRGNEALTLVRLQQKLQSLLTEVVAPSPEKTNETETTTTD